MGLKVKFSRHCVEVSGEVAAGALERAQDLLNLFEDDEVDGIIATLGGGRANEILPYMDWDRIAANPKFFCGYSDITVLLHAVGYHAGLVTYYGPTVMTEFAEYPHMPRYSRDSFMAAATQQRQLKFQHVGELAVERLDWGSNEEARRARAVGPVAPAITGRGGTAAGLLTGGCIEALERLRGTNYWPEMSGSLLLLETVSDEPNIKALHSIFVDYQNMGVWNSVEGVVFGQKNWPRAALAAVAELLCDFTRGSAIPVLVGLPFGHITPIATIPLGAIGTLDADNQTLYAESPIPASARV